MDVIRKAYCALIFVALMSFISGVAVAGDKEKININTATVEELISLKGIGVKKAHSIVEYRKEAGQFTAIEDLKNVKGVGGKIFNKIKDRIVAE